MHRRQVLKLTASAVAGVSVVSACSAASDKAVTGTPSGNAMQTLSTRLTKAMSITHPYMRRDGFCL